MAKSQKQPHEHYTSYKNSSLNMNKNNGSIAQTGKLLTSKKVAEIMNVTEATIKRWRKEGVMSFCKVGKKTIRYRESDIENFIKQQ